KYPDSAEASDVQILDPGTGNVERRCDKRGESYVKAFPNATCMIVRPELQRANLDALHIPVQALRLGSPNDFKGAVVRCFVNRRHNIPEPASLRKVSLLSVVEYSDLIISDQIGRASCRERA